MKVPTSADLSGKNVDQIAADFQIWEHVGSALWNLRNFAFGLHVAPEKIRKVSLKSPPPPSTWKVKEDLTVLKQTTQLTHKRSY